MIFHTVNSVKYKVLPGQSFFCYLYLLEAYSLYLLEWNVLLLSHVTVIIYNVQYKLKPYVLRGKKLRKNSLVSRTKERQRWRKPSLFLAIC
jgi:hypothetical protein